MKYIRVLQEIGSIAGNPTLRGNGKDLAKIAFINAISQLIREGKYDESDIPGSVKIADIDFAGAGDTEDINALGVLKVVDFFLPPGTDKDCIVTVKDPSELNKMSMLETLQPSDNDLFIYQIGMTLYGVVGSGTPVFSLGSDIVKMKFIEDIDDSGWLDSTDLQASAALQITTAFMREAISLAGASLQGEVSQ